MPGRLSRLAGSVGRSRARRAFYKHLQAWLVQTELDRYRSGRVLEYMWAVLFGEPAVLAPAEVRGRPQRCAAGTQV